MDATCSGVIMKKLRVLLLSCLSLVQGIAFAETTVVTNEDFEGGASGWSTNTTDNSVPGAFTEFLGRFGGSSAEPITKTFTLKKITSKITIEFDFYEIDSWDFEQFRVWVNGDQVSTGTFKHNRDDGPINDLPKILPGDIDGNQNSGFASWPDQGFHYVIELDMFTDSLTLGFDSTITSSIGDESWGVDNLVITQHIPDPVPFSPVTWVLLVFGLGLLGVTSKQWHKKSH
jgi:hypothetical protein